MIEFKIVRKLETMLSTTGELYINGELECYTLELPWVDNIRNVSRIPDGDYRVRVRDGVSVGSRFKYLHLHVLDVPDRSFILMHTGNRPSQIRGCILVGEELGHDAVWHSRDAFKKIMAKIDEAGVDEFPMSIVIET